MKSKVAIITGGTKGIGLTAAVLFKKNGYSFYVGARHEVSLPEGLYYHFLDIADPESCRAFIDHVLAKEERIDALVNNAGITRDGMTRKMTDEMFDEVISINLKGAFNMTRIIGPLMEKQNSGSIVNVSSIVGECGNIGQVNYAAAKAGLIGMTKCWAKEFARHGENVRVNAVAPGVIRTEMIETIPEPIKTKMIEKTALKRLGTCEEIAEVILFLADDRSSYITGAVIDANGGMAL